jgi:hypothetical protein
MSPAVKRRKGWQIRLPASDLLSAQRLKAEGCGFAALFADLSCLFTDRSVQRDSEMATREEQSQEA